MEEVNFQNGFRVAVYDVYKREYYLLASSKKSLLVPYTDALTLYHSSHRMHVEQAFGIWVKKRLLLKSPLALNLEDSTGTNVATEKLHNFCIDMREHAYNREQNIDMWEQDVDKSHLRLLWRRFVLDLEKDMDVSRYCLVEVGCHSARRRAVRKSLVWRLQRQGLLRPLWSQDMLLWKLQFQFFFTEIRTTLADHQIAMIEECRFKCKIPMGHLLKVK